MEKIIFFHLKSNPIKEWNTLDDLKDYKFGETRGYTYTVVTDNNGVIEYVNPTFSEVTGYSAKGAIGENPRIIKSGDHPESYYKDLWDTLPAGKTRHGEFLNRKKNNEEFVSDSGS